MLQITTDPVIPARPDDRPFVQTVRLTDAGKPIAYGYWHASPTRLGAIQIIDVYVEKPHRRKGMGRHLLEAILEQAVEYHRRQRRTLRQIWFPVAQKREIGARAFLAEHNFHHVATITEMLRDEDILIFKRSLD